MSDPEQPDEEEPRLIRVLDEDPNLGVDLDRHTLGKAAAATRR